MLSAKAVGDVQHLFWLEIEKFPGSQFDEEFTFPCAGGDMERVGSEVEEAFRLEGFENRKWVEFEVSRLNTFMSVNPPLKVVHWVSLPTLTKC